MQSPERQSDVHEPPLLSKEIMQIWLLWTSFDLQRLKLFLWIRVIIVEVVCLQLSLFFLSCNDDCCREKKLGQ